MTSDDKTTIKNSWEVITVTPHKCYALLLQFADGSRKIYNAIPLLSNPAYAPLADLSLFMTARAGRGTVLWNRSIDIAPAHLYERSISVSEHENVNLLMLRSIPVMFTPEEQMEMLENPYGPTLEIAEALYRITADEEVRQVCDNIIEGHRRARSTEISVRRLFQKNLERILADEELSEQLKEATRQMARSEHLFSMASDLKKHSPEAQGEVQRLRFQAHLLRSNAKCLAAKVNNFLYENPA